MNNLKMFSMIKFLEKRTGIDFTKRIIDEDGKIIKENIINILEIQNKEEEEIVNNIIEYFEKNNSIIINEYKEDYPYKPTVINKIFNNELKLIKDKVIDLINNEVILTLSLHLYGITCKLSKIDSCIDNISKDLTIENLYQLIIEEILTEYLNDICSEEDVETIINHIKFYYTEENIFKIKEDIIKESILMTAHDLHYSFYSYEDTIYNLKRKTSELEIIKNINLIEKITYMLNMNISKIKIRY